MKLTVEKDKLIFYHNSYTVTVYKQDIKKIAIFYRAWGQDGTAIAITRGENFQEVDQELLSKNLPVCSIYDVLLKIIANKKHVATKYSLIGKINYWFNRFFNFNNALIATSGNYHDSTSIMGRDNILQALNDLKNNDYVVDHLFPFFHTLLDQQTVGENLENNFKKHYKKFIALFWIMMSIIALLIISLVIIK